MITQDDTFKKLTEKTYHLCVVYANLTNARFDKIINSNEITTTLPECDYLETGPILHYYNVTMDQIVAEAYNIGMSNIRIQKRFRYANFIEFEYTANW